MNKDGQVKSLDPIALTLALWLGCVVGAAGLTRLQQQVSAQAALDEAAGKPAFSLEMDDRQRLATALGS